MQLEVNNNFATNYSYCSVTINRHPMIYFNSPTNNNEFLTGTPLILKVTVLSYDGAVTGVTYYTNSVTLGTAFQSLSNSWVYYWQNAPLWTNIISAIATDNDGLTSTASVSMVVLPPLAVKILSPTNQTLLAQATNIVITANTFYILPWEGVEWVQFFDGGSSIGYAASTNNSYQLNWMPILGGTNVLTAFASVTNGSSAWSAPVTNYVRSLPAVEITSPTNGQIFPIPSTNIIVASSATAFGATISKVIYYQGTNIIGTNSTGSPYNVTFGRC